MLRERRSAGQPRRHVRPGRSGGSKAAPDTLAEAVGDREHQRIEQDRKDGASEDEVAALRWEEVQIDPQLSKNEGKLADLCETSRDREGGRDRVPEGQHYQEGRNGLSQNNDEQCRCYRPRLTHNGRRIEKHTD